MQIIVAMLLTLTASLSAMNGFLSNGNLDLELLNSRGIIIINEKKSKDEPTFALLKERNEHSLKIYKGVFKKTPLFKSIIKKLNNLCIDNCLIDNITVLPGIKTLTITHCTIYDIDSKFGNSLDSLTITHNIFSKKAYEKILDIKKNDSVIMHNNTVIDNPNN